MCLKDIKANEKFCLLNVRNWDVIVDNIALVLLKTKIRTYKNIDVSPKLKPNNKAEIIYSCLKHDGSLDEYIVALDILGCKDSGYDSLVSQTWRECLEANFGEGYRLYVASKFNGIEK